MFPRLLNPPCPITTAPGGAADTGVAVIILGFDDEDDDEDDDELPGMDVSDVMCVRGDAPGGRAFSDASGTKGTAAEVPGNGWDMEC